MGHKLRSIPLEGGRSMNEKACENYQCRSCGESMISANFVTGICIQVFASHGENCELYPGNAFEKTKEVSCDTCRYFHDEKRCTYEGKTDSRIESVRTAG